MTGKVLTPAEVAEIRAFWWLHQDIRPLLDSHEALRAELAKALKSLMEWENKEAAICPEDVGFPEFIGSLQQQLARLRGLIEGMGHEKECFYLLKARIYPQISAKRNCNCVKSQVNI